jgi:hypothetical protein
MREKHRGISQNIEYGFGTKYKISKRYLISTYAREIENKEQIGRYSSKGKADGNIVYLGSNGGVFYLTSSNNSEYIDDHGKIIFY